MARKNGTKKPPAQKKPPLTHFLCLPLVTATSRPQLEESLTTFKAAVSSEKPIAPLAHSQAAARQDPGSSLSLPLIHPKAVRPVGALHCTLGVCSLDSTELSEAVETLHSFDTQELLSRSVKRNDEDTTAHPSSPGPLKIDLKGLESMHAAHSTSILYSAPTDHSERLHPFCLALQAAFKEKGLLVPDERALKLHATIVNTIYAKGRRPPKAPKWVADPSSQASSSSDLPDREDRSQGHGPNANAPLKIDATQLLEGYQDYVWAENVVLDRVAICEMGAKKILDDQGNVTAEEYTEVASIPLPR